MRSKNEVFNGKVSTVDLWRYEKPIARIRGMLRGGEKKKVLYVTKDVRESLIQNFGFEIQPKDFLLVRHAFFKQMEFVSKVSRDCSIEIPSRIVEKLELKTRQQIMLDVIAKKNKNVVHEASPKNYGLLAEIDLLPIVQHKSHRLEIVIFSRAKNFLTVYLLWKNGSRSTLTMPRYFPINTDSLWFLGFYRAEGGRSKSIRSVTLSNKSPYPLRRAIDFFEKVLGFPRTAWKIYVYSSNETGNTGALKTFWALELKVSPKMILIRKNRHVRSLGKNGVACIWLHGKILKILLDNILRSQILRKMIFSDREKAKQLLAGAEAGDGISVDNVRGTLYGMASHDVDEKKFWKRIFLFIGHKPRIDWNGVVVKMNHDVHLKLVKDGCFKDHPLRRKCMLQSFIKRKSVKNIVIFLSPFRKGEKFTASALSQHIFKPYRTTHYNLKKLCAKGYVSMQRRMGKKLFYELTSKGLNFLCEYSSILEELKSLDGL